MEKYFYLLFIGAIYSVLFGELVSDIKNTSVGPADAFRCMIKGIINLFTGAAVLIVIQMFFTNEHEYVFIAGNLAAVCMCIYGVWSFTYGFLKRV